MKVTKLTCDVCGNEMQPTDLNVWSVGLSDLYGKNGELLTVRANIDAAKVPVDDICYRCLSAALHEAADKFGRVAK